MNSYLPTGAGYACTSRDAGTDSTVSRVYPGRPGEQLTSGNNQCRLSVETLRIVSRCRLMVCLTRTVRAGAGPANNLPDSLSGIQFGAKTEITMTTNRTFIPPAATVAVTRKRLPLTSGAVAPSRFCQQVPVLSYPGGVHRCLLCH